VLLTLPAYDCIFGSHYMPRCLSSASAFQHPDTRQHSTADTCEAKVWSFSMPQGGRACVAGRCHTGIRHVPTPQHRCSRSVRYSRARTSDAC
jgi:hypothetical protein